MAEIGKKVGKEEKAKKPARAGAGYRENEGFSGPALMAGLLDHSIKASAGATLYGRISAKMVII